MSDRRQLSADALRTTTGSTFVVYQSVELHPAKVTVTVIFDHEQTSLPVREKVSAVASPAGRPGRALASRLEATEEGRQYVQDARRELASILDDDGLSPLAALRLRQGLSQGQLAELTGIQQPQLSRLEGGKHGNVMMATVERLALALGVPPDEVSTAIKACRAARMAADET